MTQWNREAYRALLRSRFVGDPWEVNEKGHYKATIVGHFVTFFYNRAREHWQTSGWTWVCAGQFSSQKFSTPEAARGNAFDTLYPKILGKLGLVLSKKPTEDRTEDRGEDQRTPRIT